MPAAVVLVLLDERGGTVVKGVELLLPEVRVALAVDDATLFPVEAPSVTESVEVVDAVELAVAVATVEGAEDEGVQQDR